MYTLLGVRLVDFVNDKKERIEGANIWFVSDVPDDRNIGYIPEKKWMSLAAFTAAGGPSAFLKLVNQPVEPVVDLRGRLVDVKSIK